MSASICSNYINNVYLEFNLFNNFLKDLNQKILSSNNDKYTPIYDSCIENAYNVQNKYNAWNHGEEVIDEEFMEHFSQNIIINIKAFLRNNFCCIDENLENLKNRNKKLIEKLKVDLENAENQENYIYELEKSLKLEKEKNKNAYILQEKINNLLNQNEKLKNRNDQLEMSSWKQREENSKIKVELKKILSLKEKKNEYDNSMSSYNKLNKSMSTLFKKINNNIQRSKCEKLMLEKSRNYSDNFLYTIQSIMHNQAEPLDEKNHHTGESRDKTENCSEQNYIPKKDIKISKSFHNKHNSYNMDYSNQKYQNYHVHKLTSESCNNMINSSHIFFSGGDKRGISKNDLSSYKMYNNKNFKHIGEDETIYKNVEFEKKEIIKGKCRNMDNFDINNCMHKRDFIHDDYFTVRESTLSCCNNTVLIDMRKAISNK
ncbi:unspecified product [Plasmodium gonderi]|uniref:Unspecified product n=1 Tax=Plasmodium gonderi TaxID=77519 RepID=A0A1Y1JQ29_PLAGO|nr:unspecified product [Plasmodium gonderi]GAW83585.1 unspecified product [Plasmodium gonderi]